GWRLKLEELENAFLTPHDPGSWKRGPGLVWLVVLSPDGPDWRPWGTPGASVSNVVREAAELEGLEPQAVPGDDDLPERVREAADTNTIVAVVVDPRIAPDANVVSVLSQAAETAPNNCAVLVAGVWVGEVSTGDSGPRLFGEEFAATAARLKHFAGVMRSA